MKSSKVALWNLIKWQFKTDYVNDHLLTTYLLFDENVVKEEAEHDDITDNKDTQG